MRLWPSWRKDPRLVGMVASFEIAIGDRLSVVAVSNTGVPLLRITSARSVLRKKAREVGLVWGKWPTNDGRMVSAWLPSRTGKPTPGNPFVFDNA
jgi:hypothetical protein